MAAGGQRPLAFLLQVGHGKSEGKKVEPGAVGRQSSTVCQKAQLKSDLPTLRRESWDGEVRE